MKRLLHLVNEVSLAGLFMAMIATVLAFGTAFYFAGQQGLLDFMWETDQTVGFLDALYFSVVTISSLGYGDIRPLGWARLLVGMEVFSGLAFFGLIVAKVSSVKQDYILKRMYGEAVDGKIASLLGQLEDQRLLYRTTSALLFDGEIDPDLTTTFRRDSPGATFFTQYRQLLGEISTLMAWEASNHALFGVVDDSRLEAVYDSIRGALRRTTLLWERDRRLAVDLVLCDNRDDLSAILEHAERVAQLAIRSSHNTDISRLATIILELTARIREEILPAL